VFSGPQGFNVFDAEIPNKGRKARVFSGPQGSGSGNANVPMLNLRNQESQPFQTSVHIVIINLHVLPNTRILRLHRCGALLAMLCPLLQARSGREGVWGCP
jgi:hypothetical protein